MTRCLLSHGKKICTPSRTSDKWLCSSCFPLPGGGVFLIPFPWRGSPYRAHSFQGTGSSSLPVGLKVIFPSIYKNLSPRGLALSLMPFWPQVWDCNSGFEFSVSFFNSGFFLKFNFASYLTQHSYEFGAGKMSTLTKYTMLPETIP